jgi:serine/threonine protein kinase
VSDLSTGAGPSEGPDRPDPLREALEGLGPGFELIRELGRGATAVVYLVRDRELDRDLALKVIRSSFIHDEEALARLKREARLVARLQHPNIVQLYGTRHLSDGSLVLVMEHVPGRNLKEVIGEEGPLAPPRVVAILKDVASALAYAHRRKIVHRDVKPENIYVDDEVGTARLADFGVARPWDQDTRLTLPGASLGTPAYMSPEQVDDAPVDGRSDVYSLGLVGYEMMAGEHPWEDEGLYSLIFKQKNESLPPLAPRCPGAPRTLVAIVERCLRKDPEERWDSAQAVLDRLGRVRIAEPEPPPLPADDPLARDLGRLFPEAGASTAAEGTKPPAGSGTPPAPSRNDPDPAPPSRGPGLDEAGSGATPTRTRAPRRPPRRRRRGRRLGVVVLALAAVVAGGLWAREAGWLTTLGDRAVAFLEAAGPDDDPGDDASPSAGDPGPREGGPGAPGAEGVDTLSGEVPSDPAEPPGGSPPLRLEAVGGTDRAGWVGERVDLPLAVQVLGPEGEPRPGVPVRFALESGSATVETPEALTDVQGLARTELQLAGEADSVVVRARLAGGPEVVDSLAAARSDIEFRAVARPLPVVAASSGGGQVAAPGRPLPSPLALRLTDARGQPVAGARVAFQVEEGDGSVQPSQARTDAAGWVVGRWVLGAAPGPQAVTARVPLARDTVLTFRAQATAPEPTTAAEAPEESPAITGADPPEAAAPSPDTSSLGEGDPGIELAVRRAPLAVGGSHVCRLTGSGVACDGALGDTGGEVGSAVATAAGVSHACALDRDGSAWCWGENGSGQLGDGSRGGRSAAVEVEAETPFAVAALGLGHSCALDRGGAAWCWGRNLNGQLGDGSRADSPRPRVVAGERRYIRLAAGWNHTCALAVGDRSWCWGLNDQGQLGDGSRVDRLAPVAVTGIGSLQGLAAGSRHTCGWSSDGVFCWGGNGAGQLGDGTTASRPTPAAVEGLPGRPAGLAAGALHTCALLEDGSAWCWGQNVHGQLGDGTTTPRPSPVQVEGGGATFVALEAGGGTTCGRTSGGERLCWGLNQSGQIGDGTRTNRPAPTPPAG